MNAATFPTNATCENHFTYGTDTTRDYEHGNADAVLV